MCKRCNETPGFHSFEFIADVSGIHFFYCFPAHNKESVKTHEDMINFVSHFPKDKRWSLLFHAKGYGLSHMMPLPLALEMGKIVQTEHRMNLQTIYIVQGSWFMKFLCLCIFPFLRSDMRTKFVALDGSLLEVVQAFKSEGLSVSQLQPLRDRFI